MKKIINISIEARMESTRLPGKTLKLINGKPALEIMVNRVKQTKLANKIIISTTIKKKDDQIINWCKLNNLDYFRGSENNVYDRVIETHKKFNTDIIVELTGDCILITAELVDRAIQIYLDNKYDYVNVTDISGMGAQVYSLKTLQSIKNFKELEYTDKEHVTPYLYNSGKYKIFNTIMYNNLGCPEVKLPLDTIEDWNLIDNICKNFDNFNFSFEDIIEYLKKNPEIISFNSHIKRKGLN